MCTRENFFEICRQFGHTSSKMFVSYGLDSTSIRRRLFPSKFFTIHPSLIIRLLDAMEPELLTAVGNTHKKKRR